MSARKKLKKETVKCCPRPTKIRQMRLLKRRSDGKHRLQQSGYVQSPNMTIDHMLDNNGQVSPVLFISTLINVIMYSCFCF